MTATLDTLQAVVEDLQGRGLPAVLEYPGWISLDGWAIGTANGTWAANSEDLERGVDSGVPGNFEDVELVADAIVFMLGTCRPSAPPLRSEVEGEFGRSWSLPPPDLPVESRIRRRSGCAESPSREPQKQC